MQRTVLVSLGVALATSLATVAAWHYFGPQPAAAPAPAPGAAAKPPAADVEPDDLRLVAAEGTLEPLSGLIDVGGLPGDRLLALRVREGSQVKQGDELAVLESLELRQAELDYAKAALRAAEERRPLEEEYGDILVAEARQGIELAARQQLEVDAQRAKLAPAEQGLRTIREDQRRVEPLDESIVSAQERSHLALKVAQAEAEKVSAEKLLARLEQTVALGQAQAQGKLREAEVGKQRLVSALQLDTLRENVKLAEARLKLASVRAPADGTVLQVISRVGESLGARPILRLGDTSQMVAVTEVDESQIRRVGAGMEATITSPALDEELHGAVTDVGRLVGKNEVLSLEPTRSTDARVVKVRVLLDPPSAAIAASLVNLQVTVRIDTQKLRSP